MRVNSADTEARDLRTKRLMAIALAIWAIGLSVSLYGQAAYAAETEDGHTPPAGLLTAFEERRHADFVSTAQAGNIDVLFIGDSSVEFWQQDGEGKSVWETSFAKRAAANFGVQGASLPSVLWRLKNGELDGYQAKVIVFDGMWTAASSKKLSIGEIIAGNAAIIDELRRRQPQAKIILTVVPRTRFPENPNRSIETALTADFARRSDNRHIHFIDTRATFLKADGSLDTMVLSGRGNAMNARGYSAWAQAIAPKLSELMPAG